MAHAASRHPRDLTDEQWALIGPFLPTLPRRRDGRGRPWRQNRAVLNGILWVLRTGAPWADLPDRYPSYQTCHRRFQHWVRAGLLRSILEILAQALHDEGYLDLQEAFIDVAKRVNEYLQDPSVPFYVWLRFLTVQRMQMVQRAHLGAQMRDVGMEAGGDVALASSESMAGQLVGNLTSPSQVAIRREVQDRLRAALDEMDSLDREVLALRHFEELGNNEVAEVLGISKDAASKRHIRALKRLKEILGEPAA